MHQLDMMTHHAHLVQRRLTVELEQNKTGNDKFPRTTDAAKGT
jgi:hypothetical protein